MAHRHRIVWAASLDDSFSPRADFTLVDGQFYRQEKQVHVKETLTRGVTPGGVSLPATVISHDNFQTDKLPNPGMNGFAWRASETIS